MRMFQVHITAQAERQFETYLAYLVNKKQNLQAAISVSEDFDDTIEQLKTVAGSMRLCDDQTLKNRGIRKIMFRRHDYIMLYKVLGNEVIVEAIYHTLQDYENTFKRHEG